MFKVNDYVMYGRTGVCQVTEIKSGKYLGKSEIDYYVLQPVFENNSVIMTPMKNRKVLMREIASRQEVFSLINSIEDQETLWIDNDKLRNEKFKSLIKNGLCEEWIALIKTINLKNEERKSIGKKISQMDEGILKEAKKLLYEEFSLALEIHPEEVEDFIKDRVEG